jgi:hypothetical protein
MKSRKAFLDMRLHAAQRIGVLVGLQEDRDGAEADRLGQPLCRSLRVDLGARDRCDLKLPRAVGEGIEGEGGGEDDDRGDEEQQDVAADF